MPLWWMWDRCPSTYCSSSSPSCYSCSSYSFCSCSCSSYSCSCTSPAPAHLLPLLPAPDPLLLLLLFLLLLAQTWNLSKKTISYSTESGINELGFKITSYISGQLKLCYTTCIEKTTCLDGPLYIVPSVVLIDRSCFLLCVNIKDQQWNHWFGTESNRWKSPLQAHFVFSPFYVHSIWTNKVERYGKNAENTDLWIWYTSHCVLCSVNLWLL